MSTINSIAILFIYVFQVNPLTSFPTNITYTLLVLCALHGLAIMLGYIIYYSFLILHFQEVTSQMLPKIMTYDELPKPHRKVSRLRTIGHQIRYAFTLSPEGQN